VPPSLDDPASPLLATVNGLALYRSVYDTQLALMAGAAQDPPMSDEDASTPPMPDLLARTELLDILVKIELATQEAYQLGFAPSKEVMIQSEARAVEAAGGAKELEDALAQTGGTMEQFRNQLERNEAMRAWRDNAFLSGAKVTDAEARAFYDAHIEEAAHGDEVRAAQIMFPLPIMQGPQAEEAKTRARRRAEEAAAQSRNGMDFAELQRAYMDPATAAAVDGGQLGWVGKMGSFPELEELLFSLKPGDTGGPLETAFSIHVVKVLETREAGTTPYMALRPDIITAIAESKIDELAQARSVALLEAAEVTVHDPELAASWAEYRRTGAVESAPPDPGAAQGGAEGASPEASGEASGEVSGEGSGEDSAEASGDGSGDDSSGADGGQPAAGEPGAAEPGAPETQADPAYGS
jgi:parvulin-like peptidyl-prolyl isomerase